MNQLITPESALAEAKLVKERHSRKCLLYNYSSHVSAGWQGPVRIIDRYLWVPHQQQCDNSFSVLMKYRPCADEKLAGDLTKLNMHLETFKQHLMLSLGNDDSQVGIIWVKDASLQTESISLFRGSRPASLLDAIEGLHHSNRGHPPLPVLPSPPPTTEV